MKPSVFEIQQSFTKIRLWINSEDCPIWGKALANISIGLIEQIFQQRELGRYEAFKNFELPK